jgi:hypothetical protein
VEEGKRERERASGAAAHSVDVGLGWLRAAWSKAAARTRGGGGLVNRGGRRGAGDAVRLTGGAGKQQGPVVSGGVQKEERKAR